MSPNGQAQGKKITAPNNVYTVILAIACGVVVATAIFVLLECNSQYGVMFKMP